MSMHYKLLVPEIRNGLVLYINIELANLNTDAGNSEVDFKPGTRR